MNASSTLSRAGLGIAVVSAVAAVSAGLGTRAGWWHFRTGFQILTWAAYGGLGSMALAFGGLLMARWRRPRRDILPAVIGLVIGLMVVGIPWQQKQTAQRVPAIHDITTDMEAPPGFVAVLPRRSRAPNPAEYGGPLVAAQQQAAYPSIKPLLLDLPLEQAFQKALAVAQALEWEIVAADVRAGRIEATDTTFWFGFQDDIVVRLRAVEPGTRIDVRSVSRVGRSDVGTNAKRIATYLQKLAVVQK